jgi:hypothetical protein
MRPRIQFSIKDIVWLTVVVALCFGWGRYIKNTATQLRASDAAMWKAKKEASHYQSRMMELERDLRAAEIDITEKRQLIYELNKTLGVYGDGAPSSTKKRN